MAKAKQPKLTGQQEIFAREYVRCGIGAQAYRMAYKVDEASKPETVWVEASKLLANPKVRQRVDHLTALAGARAGVTLEKLIVELDQNRNGALDDRVWPAANAATLGKAKLLGFTNDDPNKTGDIHIHLDALLKGVL